MIRSIYFRTEPKHVRSDLMLPADVGLGRFLQQLLGLTLPQLASQRERVPTPVPTAVRAPPAA
jgi:hypothetical protein